MIHKYVKLPVEIEAVQFTRDNFEEIKSFTNGIAKSFTIERCPNGKCWCIIPTLEGDHMAMDMDSGDLHMISSWDRDEDNDSFAGGRSNFCDDEDDD